MLRLLMDLVRLECRIAGLASAAGLRGESQQALDRAEYYLRLRADEAGKGQPSAAERRRRVRAFLRGAT
jgi:hypothetical protein